MRESGGHSNDIIIILTWFRLAVLIDVSAILSVLVDAE